ncbi:copper resistance protein CopC [Cohnella sp. GCM10027633]|uniref:copper resistance CopC family protein n=1 Tax=unclassified Cohnella TaxID=2636738 RepID=UPI003644D04B
MKRVYMLLVALGLFAIVAPNAASAHSVVESSEPAAGAVAQEALPRITITFNTSVEIVSLKVTNESGDSQPLSLEEDGATVTGTFEQPLSVNGAYTAAWHIIGADGHPIKGKYDFSLAVPEPTALPSATPVPSAPEQPASTEETVPATPSPSAPTDQPATDQAATESPSTGADSDAPEPKGSPDVSMWILGAAGCLLLAAVIVTLAKKKGK